MRTAGLIVCAALLALPSAVFGQADSEAEAAIREGSMAWQAAWNAGDGAALAGLYTDDAIVFAPGSEPLKGGEAIQAGLQAAVDEAGGSQMAIKTGEVTSHGNMAVEVGSFVETAADGSHKDHGNYIAIWKKTNGGWMIVRDIWNSGM